MLRHFIAFVCLLAAGGIASAQFVAAYLEKSSTFIQTSNDSVVPSNAWIFSIQGTQRFYDTQSVRITTPFAAAMIRAANQSDWLWNSAYFPSRASFDAAYPDSKFYRFDFVLAASLGNATLTLDGPKLPDFPPVFLGNAYDALQGVNPNQDIALSLDGFTIPASAATAQARLDVRDLDHSVFVFSAVHDGNGPAQFTIPAGVLKPQTAYYVQAAWTGQTVRKSSVSDIDLLTTAGSLRTQLTFITRSCVADLTGDGISDLEDFFAFFNCWDISAPCADIDGTPGVDLGDFFAFFDAFDGSC